MSEERKRTLSDFLLGAGDGDSAGGEEESSAVVASCEVVFVLPSSLPL